MPESLKVLSAGYEDAYLLRIPCVSNSGDYYCISF
jgi:hypothetical protein